MIDPAAPAYPVTARNRLKRRHDRGRYDHASVHAILDSGMLCQVAYVIDAKPYATPTLYWREGTRLYWHGWLCCTNWVRGGVPLSPDRPILRPL